MKIIQLIGKIKDEPNADKYFADAKKHIQKLLPKAKIWTPQEIVRKYQNYDVEIMPSEDICLALCIQNFIDLFIDDENIEIYALWNIVENSKGALLEHKIADALGIPVTLILKSDIYGEENE